MKEAIYSTDGVLRLNGRRRYEEDGMKQLGRLDRYQKELTKITRAKDIPSEWASPDQRCRAAIKAIGRYGRVIPLNRDRKRPQRSAEK
jgi:hypothetical protein